MEKKWGDRRRRIGKKPDLPKARGTCTYLKAEGQVAVNMGKPKMCGVSPHP